MKQLLTILLILSCFCANATDYYFSATGSDAAAGTSAGTAWQTITKFNSVFSSKSPGDRFLFNRGDTFYGALTISRSGSLGSPITIGAYGTGDNPIITGFTTVSAWTNLGGNIWESTSAVSTLSSDCNMVTINGVNTPMGRYPNTGALTYQSHSGNTSITSSSLTGTPNWTGAASVIRKNRWTWERGTITAQSGGTLTYTDGGDSQPIDGFGFFIQSDSRTLDVQNEWYYNKSNKKLQIYSTTTPSNVQIATIETLVTANAKSYITFDNITFTGANSNAFSFSNNCPNITITNCTINNIGINGIYGVWAPNIDVENNTITNCNYTGISLDNACPNAIIKNNVVRFIDMLPGMTQPHPQGSISFRGIGSVAKYNIVDSSGYDGIAFRGNNTAVVRNLVMNSCMILDDGGAIYTGFANETGKLIDSNIIINVPGSIVGANNTLFYANGIYIDDNGTSTTISNNTIYGTASSGIKIHDANHITIRNNTTFNNGGSTSSSQGGLEYLYDAGADTIRAISVYNNNFFVKLASQYAVGIVTVANDITKFGMSDSNYYARPIDDNLVFTTYQPSTGSVKRNLSGWQSFTAQDLNSKKSPKSITSVDSLRFEYNATNSPKVISLPKKFIDVAGNVYNGTITLQPYTSAVLIQNGAIAPGLPPTVTTSGDQSITVSSTNIFSAPVPASGQTITSYLWTKVSGPSCTIANPTSQNTGLSGLLTGSYKFRITVKQTDGQTAYAEVNVNVTLPNVPPVVNAGPDQFIVLPQTTLSGSVTPASGTTATYVWTKLSGNGSIINETTLTPTISGLSGLSAWRLTANQSDGQTVYDDVYVTATLSSNKWTLRGKIIFKNKPQIN